MLTTTFDSPRPLDTILSSERSEGAVRIIGEVDAFTAPIFASLLGDVVDDPQIEVVDLSGVTFFDSRGASVLERFEMQRQRTVIGSPAIAKVLGILGKSRLLTGLAQAA
ncbi:STAS domain-containing protein [Ilumatobacter sp.]|uniref:STAS domain-containing protein n=1 Tax=Ilumatobacter sp. TaxID=1967498 RepID=UPI003B5183B2